MTPTPSTKKRKKTKVRVSARTEWKALSRRRRRLATDEMEVMASRHDREARQLSGAVERSFYRECAADLRIAARLLKEAAHG